MNDPEKRTCPYCAEVIRPEAKVCPRCRQWLTYKSFRHPLVALLVHAVPMLALCLGTTMAVFAKIDDWQNPKPHYSEFPDALKIVESRMNWAQTPDGLYIYLTGVLTNTSPVQWKNVEFDCRFFDAHGAMVDAGNGRGRFTIGARDDSAFRVSIGPTAPTNDYVSFKIAVSDARNAKSAF